MGKYKLPYQLSDIQIPGDMPPALAANWARRQLRLLNGLTKRPKKQPRKKKIHPIWKKWEAAARKFHGLDGRLLAKARLRHITRTASGFQVRIHRVGKEVFSRCIRGHSEESLLEAVRLRDEGVRQWPIVYGRTNQIPASVLQALGLTQPVVGISRFPRRSAYRVTYRDRTGQMRLRQFYYRVVREEVAYAAAIAFVQSRLSRGRVLGK